MHDAFARMVTQESPVVSANNNDNNNAKKKKSKENRHNSAFTPRALGVHNFYIC